MSTPGTPIFPMDEDVPHEPKKSPDTAERGKQYIRDPESKSSREAQAAAQLRLFLQDAHSVDDVKEMKRIIRNVKKNIDLTLLLEFCTSNSIDIPDDVNSENVLWAIYNDIRNQKISRRLKRKQQKLEQDIARDMGVMDIDKALEEEFEDLFVSPDVSSDDSSEDEAMDKCETCILSLMPKLRF